MIFYCLNVKNDFLQPIIILTCIVWNSFIPASAMSFMKLSKYYAKLSMQDILL